MEITEVRVKLMEEPGERLQAFCSITFDDAFVVRDLKIIEGTTGPFVAMPSRKLATHCPQCGYKNHLRAAYCNQCGGTAERTANDQRRRRPHETLCRHRPSDQFRLPRTNPAAGHQGLRGRAEPGETARLHPQLRRLRGRRCPVDAASRRAAARTACGKYADPGGRTAAGATPHRSRPGRSRAGGAGPAAHPRVRRRNLRVT